MKVYILFHADLEDDRYVRGVFATAELAESQVSVHEPSDVANINGQRWFKTHHEWCCSVEEIEVQTEAPHVYHGPDVPYLGPRDEAGSLIGRHLYETVFRMMTRQSPYSLDDDAIWVRLTDT